MAYSSGGGAAGSRDERDRRDREAPAGRSAPATERIRPLRVPQKLPRCPELDCVRHLLSPATIALAELRSAEVGADADRVLIAQGLLGEEAYLTALSAALGTPFEPLDGTPRDACPLNDSDLLQAAATGLLPLEISGESKLVVVPLLVGSRRLVGMVTPGSDVARRMQIASAAGLQQFVTRHAADEIEHRAAGALRAEHPELSAGAAGARAGLFAAIAAATASATLISPSVGLVALEWAFGLVFFAWTGLRLLGISSSRENRPPKPVTPDHELPVYTIIVALYREAAAVRSLLAAIRQLNYPPEKIDLKLVLEADDHETRAAIENLQLASPFEIIVAPEGGPRTKPKALNAALPFARGKFVAIYDAEDRPEPDQLRLALEAFVPGDAKLACVQARLTIDNTGDSWLARLFTAEYAGLFDVFLPGLAAWRLPLPLGGSSNHFRTAVLRDIGAWDPYNVTEDADLGMRLVRFGYRSAVIPSTTYEEAPAHFGPWLRQRTRWFKGWLQTWLVHMRAPRQLLRELRWPGYVVFQLLMGGTVLAALVHVLFAAEFVWALARGDVQDGSASHFIWLHAGMLALGYGVSAGLAMMGLARRGLLSSAWVLLLIPIYWLLLSLAAWRALIQLVRDPYRWEKTEHGLAKTSRLAEQAGQADARPLTDSGANPPRPLPAGA